MNIQKVNSNVSIPMSNVLIEKYFDGGANIIGLRNIRDNMTIEDLFKNRGHVIIFISINAIDNGHWVCMFRNKNGLFYFDSYGEKPLAILNRLPNKWDQTTALLNIVKSSPYSNSFFYNTKQYQQDGTKSQVCGRYCTFICMLNKMIPNFNLDVFESIMENAKKANGLKTYDQTVAFLVDQNMK